VDRPYELLTFDIDRAPEYKALSYTWGDPLPLHNFSIEGY